MCWRASSRTWHQNWAGAEHGLTGDPDRTSPRYSLATSDCTLGALFSGPNLVIETWTNVYVTTAPHPRKPPNAAPTSPAYRTPSTRKWPPAAACGSRRQTPAPARSHICRRVATGWAESSARNGNFIGHEEGPCRPECAGYYILHARLVILATPAAAPRQLASPATGRPPVIFFAVLQEGRWPPGPAGPLPPVDRMTWGVVSPGLGVPSETLIRGLAPARPGAMPGSSRAGGLHNVDARERPRRRGRHSIDTCGGTVIDIDETGVFLGLDVGKSNHHGHGLIPAGKKVFDKAMPNGGPGHRGPAPLHRRPAAHRRPRRRLQGRLIPL